MRVALRNIKSILTILENSIARTKIPPDTKTVAGTCLGLTKKKSKQIIKKMPKLFLL